MDLLSRAQLLPPVKAATPPHGSTTKNLQQAQDNETRKRTQ